MMSSMEPEPSYAPTRGPQTIIQHPNLEVLSEKDGTHISIGNVKHLMIGNNSTMVIGARPASEVKYSNRIKEFAARHPLTKSQEPLSMDQKCNIKDRVGRHWRDLGRRLGFSDPELEQLELDHPGNCSEVIYQILIKWEQRSTNPATREALALVFHRMKRGDLADLLFDDEPITIPSLK